MIIIQNWAHDNNSRDFGVITLCSDESTDVMRLNFAQLQSFPPRKKKKYHSHSEFIHFWDHLNLG